jgi:transcriptional regulator with XRE-family HTH domain
VADDTSTLIAENLKALRERLGWSQAALAEHSGVPRPTIAHLEAGQANPTLAVALKVAHALGVTVDGLVEPRTEAVFVESRAVPQARAGKARRATLIAPFTAQDGVLERFELRAGARCTLETSAGQSCLVWSERGEVHLSWETGEARLPPEHRAWLRVGCEVTADEEAVVYRLSGLGLGQKPPVR